MLYRTQLNRMKFGVLTKLNSMDDPIRLLGAIDSKLDQAAS